MYHLSLDPYYLLSYTNTFRYSHAFRSQCFGHSWPYRYYSRFRSTFSCNFLWSWQPLFCSFSIPLTSSTLWYDEKILNDTNKFSPVQHYWGNSCSPQEHCGDPWSWGRYWHFCPGCHTSWRVWGGFDAGVVPLEETSRGFPWLKKITSQLMIFSTSFIAKNLKKE